MKCGFCGNELENGAQFCPNCGMIISLGEENEAAQENDTVVESVYNVFKSNIEKEKKEAPVQTAKELEIDPTEEKVEFVMSLPEFEEYIAEPIKAPEHIELPDHSVKKEVIEEAVAKPETAEEAAEETDEVAEISEVSEETEPETEEVADEHEDIYSYSSEEAKEQDEAEMPLDIKVPEVDVIYEGPEKAPAPIEVPVVAPKNEKLRQQKQAKENLEKISPDKKKPAKKEKKGIDGIKIESVLGIAVAVVLVLFACVYAVKNDKIPVLGELFGQDTTTTEASVTDDITTEEPSAEEDTTESTTEEDTTESTTESTTETTTESTTEPTTKETTETTTKVTTTKPTTTKPTTTKPTTTKPVVSTTKPAATTTKPVTTKPVTTTKPAATKPNVTEGFGINDVEVKKPVSYLSKSYTAYVTVEGLTLRSKPTTDSYKVLSLSKGADVVVLAKENGFLYIKSNRYGVYGWVSASYVANERPQSESVVQSGTVAPDKKYATAEIKYTTNGLNVRKGPSTSHAIVGLVPISYPVKVIGYKSGVSGWVYIQDTTYGYTGWVSTAYLK